MNEPQRVAHALQRAATMIVVASCYLFPSSFHNMAFFLMQKKPLDCSLTLLLANPAYKEETAPDVFKLEGDKYRCCSLIASKGKKRTAKSVIWQYSEALQRLKDGQKVYYCYYCEIERRQQDLVAMNEGTQGALQHLIKVHQINKNSKKVNKQLHN